MREDGTVHQILQSRLKVAVEIGMSQDAVRLILSSVYIYMTLQHDMVLRKGSRLIGAKDVHCAKVLYGIKVLNDGFLPRHHHRSL